MGTILLVSGITLLRMCVCVCVPTVQKIKVGTPCVSSGDMKQLGRRASAFSSLTATVIP